MRGKPFVDKRFSPAPPSKKLFSGGAAGPRRWTVGSGQRPVDRENRKRKALCLPLPVFGTYGVPCVRSVPLNGCPVQNKNAEGRVPSAFYVMSAGLFVRKPCLSCHFCRGTGNGGCPASYRGVHPPAQSALGGGWGLGGRRDLCAQAGDRRRPQAVPVATKEATGIDSRAMSLLPPKNLLTCGRSAGEARRGSCGRRPACGRRG